MATNYGNADYWDNRYRDEEECPYDWLFCYEDVKPVIEYLIPSKNVKILMIGCGNAPFSPDMYNVGNYNQIVNIDLSSVAITQQASKFPEQIWKVMNALNMDFADGSFPVVIDKSLIDTLLCASGSKDKVECMIKECQRVLQPGGRFITFSLHTIEEVEEAYKSVPGWRVSCFRIYSNRWDSSTNRKRSRAHTMVVCDKACVDGTYLHEHPLHIPEGTLSEEEFAKLKEEADTVNLNYAMRKAPTQFLLSALYHALNGESLLRTMRCKYMEEVCARAKVDVAADGQLSEGDELENLSMTSIVGDTELIQQADFSLRDYVDEAKSALRAILKFQKRNNKSKPVSAIPAPSLPNTNNADAQ